MAGVIAAAPHGASTALPKMGHAVLGSQTRLAQLRKAGLIEVEERPRKSPVVKVRFKEQVRPPGP